MHRLSPVTLPLRRFVSKTTELLVEKISFDKNFYLAEFRSTFTLSENSASTLSRSSSLHKCFKMSGARKLGGIV